MNKIVLKNSSVPGAIPTPDDLVLGEVAINIADGRLYTRRGDQVVSLAQSVDLRAFGRITGDVGYIEPENPQEPMTLKGGSGLKVTAMHATKDIRIDLDNADAATLGGHAASYFATADHLHDDRYVLKSESGGDYYTQAQVDANIQQAIDDLINGAGSAYDTLKELEAALLDNDSDIAAINSAIATKLDASAYTAEDVLAKLKTVTGDGSGLDADTLNGNNGSFYRNASNLNAGTVPVARLSGIYDVGISGNAATASKFASAITLTLSGDASGSVSLDGSGDVTLNATVKNDSHTHDTRYYTKTQSDERFFLLDDVATQEEVLSESSSNVVNVDGLWAAIRKYGLGGSGRKVSTNHDVFDADLITDSGFYGLFGSAVNTFPGQQSGDTMIHTRWGTDHQSQIGIGQSNQMFFRYQNDGVWRSWNKVWHDNNMGADSGLDADKLDGLQATSFVRTDADSTINAGADTTLSIRASDSGNATLAIHGDNQGTGRVYVGQDGLYGGGLEYNGDGTPETTGAGVDCLTLWRRANGADHWTARNKYSSDVWEFKVAPTVGEYPVWHAGNQGADSGLDADTVDGLQASQLARVDQETVFQASIGVGGSAPGKDFDNGKAIALNDDDSGIRGNGDGTIEIWANNQEIVQHTSQRATFRKDLVAEQDVTVSGTVSTDGDVKADGVFEVGGASGFQMAFDSTTQSLNFNFMGA
ncbi:pyocin knob domain-containing protein [Halomonas sp. S2151]|uniref:pyocin knob domain-containing protein n=1 Tax=Halomonas sp. S2151 TaxID=579478 RepID=UPI000A5EE477|nr:pyocin knob domain-containing protein [Halomonas sp. S2151]